MLTSIILEHLLSMDSPEQLLKHAYQCDDLADIELPIEIHDIVKSINTVHFSDKLSFDDWDKSGYIKVNRGDEQTFTGVDIWINSAEVWERQRFTLAHEVGHLIFDVLPNIDNINKDEVFEDKLHRDGSVNMKERRANQFAAKLLMPSILVDREVKKLVTQIKTEERTVSINHVIDRLSAVFSVSTQSMRYRLENLGYISSR